jgi:hypothetical protein
MTEFRRPSLESGWAIRTSFFLGVVIGLVAGLILGAISGCDRVTRVEDIGPARIESGRDSCTYAGYCMCSYQGFKFRFCATCQGHQRAVHRITPYKATYESGDVKFAERVETISTDGQCE